VREREREREREQARKRECERNEGDEGKIGRKYNKNP
jgi:hypothetical protein